MLHLSGVKTNTRCKRLSISLLSLIRTDVIPAEYIKENLFILSDPLLGSDTLAGGDGVGSAGIKDRAV